jgi:hypothetical protein
LRWSTSKRPSARGPPRTAAGKASARHHGERSHGLALPNQTTCGREGNPPDRDVCPKLASHSPPQLAAPPGHLTRARTGSRVQAKFLTPHIAPPS